MAACQLMCVLRVAPSSNPFVKGIRQRYLFHLRQTPLTYLRRRRKHTLRQTSSSNPFVILFVMPCGVPVNLPQTRRSILLCVSSKVVLASSKVWACFGSVGHLGAPVSSYPSGLLRQTSRGASSSNLFVKPFFKPFVKPLRGFFVRPLWGFFVKPLRQRFSESTSKMTHGHI